MAKYPHGPAVKTRLGPSLGSAQRARLYEAFLADKLAQVRSVPEATCVLAFTPHEHRPWFERAAGGALLYPQVEGDLGARVTAAFDAWCPRFPAGVILSDSDSPTLPTHRLEQAVDALRAGSELVLGPADDGG